MYLLLLCEVLTVVGYLWMESLLVLCAEMTHWKLKSSVMHHC